MSWCRWFFSLAQTVVHFGTAPVTHFAMFSFFWTGGVTSTLHKLRYEQTTFEMMRNASRGPDLQSAAHERIFVSAPHGSG